MRMGFVKKEKMFERDGKPCTVIGNYYVIKNSEHMTGIYTDYGSRMVTSKPKWSQAIKLAKLLNEAYQEGREDCKGDYF
jgi:hypothetical protein